MFLGMMLFWKVPFGIILMFITASIDYRRFRRWTPAIYGLSLLLLLAVLSPAGQRVNGAKAWIALPGGFQIEPSEFAKLGLVLATAWILSRRRIEPTEPKKAGRPGMKDVGLAVLAGLHLPRRIGWREMIVIAFASSIGFTFALFFVAGTVSIGGELSAMTGGSTTGAG